MNITLVAFSTLLQLFLADVEASYMTVVSWRQTSKASENFNNDKRNIDAVY